MFAGRCSQLAGDRRPETGQRPMSKYRNPIADRVRLAAFGAAGRSVGAEALNSSLALHVRHLLCPELSPLLNQIGVGLRAGRP